MLSLCSDSCFRPLRTLRFSGLRRRTVMQPPPNPRRLVSCLLPPANLIHWGESGCGRQEVDGGAIECFTDWICSFTPDLLVQLDVRQQTDFSSEALLPCCYRFSRAKSSPANRLPPLCSFIIYQRHSPTGTTTGKLPFLCVSVVISTTGTWGRSLPRDRSDINLQLQNRILRHTQRSSRLIPPLHNGMNNT
jgi:hypothetical protein